MEARWPGRRAGSFVEIGIKLILYAKNCLLKRIHTAESTYVCMTLKEYWNEFFSVLTPTSIQTRA